MGEEEPTGYRVEFARTMRRTLQTWAKTDRSDPFAEAAAQRDLIALNTELAATLKAARAANIPRLRAAGLTLKRVAEIYGITPARVDQILRGFSGGQWVTRAAETERAETE